MPENKFVISQDVKALIQSVGPTRCNIFMIQNNSQNVGGGKNLWEIFKGLPEPRWKSLKMLLAKELRENIPVNNQRAIFAGVSPRTLKYWNEEAEMGDKTPVPQITEKICDQLMLSKENPRCSDRK